MECDFRKASLEDIPDVLRLHERYQVDLISEEDKKDGFITTALDEGHLIELISKEQGLFVAVNGDTIVAYVMAASWEFCSRWPIFALMIKELPSFSYKGISLSVDNSYQYGPVCVNKSARGRGVFDGLFAYALSEMSKRYPILVTFIHQANTRSLAAHTRKVGLDVVREFEFDNKHYYKLACLTARGS